MTTREKTPQTEAHKNDIRSALEASLKLSVSPSSQEIDRAIGKFSSIFADALQTVMKGITPEDIWEGYKILAQSTPKMYPVLCSARALQYLRSSEQTENALVDHADYRIFIWARVLTEAVDAVEQLDFTTPSDPATGGVAERKNELLHDVLQQVFASTIPDKLKTFSVQVRRSLAAILFAEQNALPQDFFDESNHALQPHIERVWKLGEQLQEDELTLLSIIGSRRSGITELDVLLYAKNNGLLGFNKHTLVELFREYSEEFVSQAAMEKRIAKVVDQLGMEERIASAAEKRGVEEEIENETDVNESITLGELHPVLAFILDESGIDSVEHMVTIDVPDITNFLKSAYKLSDTGAEYYLRALSQSIRSLMSQKTWLTRPLRELRKWERTILRPNTQNIEFSWSQAPSTPFADIPLFLLAPSKLDTWKQLAKYDYHTLGSLVSEANAAQVIRSSRNGEFDLVRSAFELFVSHFGGGSLSPDDEKIIVQLQLILRLSAE